MGGSEYFNSIHYGTGIDPATESELLGAFCIERKIDLTSYIKWWGPNRSRQAETGMESSEETKNGCVGDIGVELKTLEWGIQPTEPYQMPRLGISHVSKKHKGTRVSAMSILSWSTAYKNLQEKASQMEENNADNDENENKNTFHKMDYGKAVEKSTSHEERLSSVLGMSGGMSLQTDVFPLAPFLSAPLLTNYNAIDPLVDGILWKSLAPVLPSGISCTTEVDYKDGDKFNFHFISARRMMLHFLLL